MKNYLTILTFLLVSITSFSQTKITGTVTDDFDFPLLGASVLVKDTTNGTVTDENGMFEIEIESGQALQIAAGTESFGAYDATQQGFGGAFYYTRLNYNF